MGKTQEKWVTHQNGWNSHLKYHLQLKTEEDVGGSGLGCQRGGMQFTWRWKSKCLENKCLLGQQRQWDSEKNFKKQTLLGSSLSATQFILYISMGIAHLLEWVLALHSSRLLRGGKQKEFLSLLLLKNNQPKLVLMPKRHILGSTFAPLRCHGFWISLLGPNPAGSEPRVFGQVI